MAEEFAGTPGRSDQREVADHADPSGSASSGTWLFRPSVAAAVGLAEAFAVGLVMHLLHAGHHEAHAIDPTLHWLRDSSLAVPLAVVAMMGASHLAARALRRRGPTGTGRRVDGVQARVVWSLLGAAAYAAVSVPAGMLHARLFGAAGHAGAGLASEVGHGIHDAAAVLGTAFAFLVAVAFLPAVVRAVSARWREDTGGHRRRPRPVRAAAMAGSLATALVAGVTIPLPAPLDTTPSAVGTAEAATTACSATSAAQRYDVVAINLDIPFNRWGDTNRHGLMYVLQGDKAAVENWSRPLNADPSADPAGNRRLRPRPLVLRANAGECVEVKFTNRLNATQGEGLPDNPRASMHVHGPSYNVHTSDGSSVGFNDDSTVAIGEQTTYYWRAPSKEGLHLFEDHGIPAGTEADGGSKSHGLYGALAVEPAGSIWTDPVSGARLYSGTKGQSGDLYVEADIKPPTGNAFRESVQLAQDEIPTIGFGFNYGSEPQRNRLARLCPDCVGEETSLSSWAYGDPALIKLASGPGPWPPSPAGANVEDCGLPGSCWVSNVTHAYVGDPTKIRFALAGVKETHVFHMHAHQWLAEPNDSGSSGTTPGTPSDTRKPESTTVDSQTFGPGDTFTADLLFGAGSKPGSFGDSIFHCHLYPHFAEGFWSLFRVHDVREDGSGATPDGITVRNLAPLPARTAPADPTATNPGYPRFVPGSFGWRAPQPPGGVTDGGPGGTAAERIVAGSLLDPAKVAVEQAVQERNYGTGVAPKPGAPFRDPCPAGSREVTYNVSVIQRDIVYNEAGEHDTQGRLLVLDRDVAAVRAGTKAPEPLFIRVNAGDCVNFKLTNLLPNWIGNDAFLKLSQTNMVGEHIHLVKFDVTGSDGASNGWNYQQAAFSKDQVAFNGEVLNGSRPCSAGTGCRLPLPADYDPTYSGAPAGQTIHERWYADYELRTVFTHDHHFPVVDQNRGLFGALIVEPKGMDMRDPRTARYFQPINSSTHGTVCGAACEGGAAGTAMDVIGPGTKDDFREFGLGIQDFVSLTRKGGNPRLRSDTINPPREPEDFPDADPGTMAVNYKNAPLRNRRAKNGTPVDPAYIFSSTTWGDPLTPLLQTYSGDNVRLRVLQGSQEEQHVLQVHGMRWRQEPNDPQSPYVNSQALGVSDAFNFEMPGVSCGSAEPEERCRGDFLYSGGATDDLFEGMWGILRVHKKQYTGLQPLPDNVPPEFFKKFLSSFDRVPAPSGVVIPAPATNPGNPCPSTAPKRTFNVVAMERKVTYNGFGDHDPYGLIYALASDEAAIRAGTKTPAPLAIRANAGDCVEVTLANKITSAFLAHAGASDGDALLPTEPPTGTPAGLRASLHPQLLAYDVRGSDGATVGTNLDQTVAPGQSRTYRWYASPVTPGELGATNLVDYGDVRGHRHHGMFAGLNVEPKGSTFHDPVTGSPTASGVSSDIRHGSLPDFREHTVFFQDGLNLRDASGAIIDDPFDHPPLPGEEGELMDAEDRGEKAFNYANAPFHRRLGLAEPLNPLVTPDPVELAGVYSSRRHGDPSTPIFRTYAGDRVRLRVLQGADKPRQHAFSLAGHAWMAQPDDPGSTLVATQGGVSVTRAFTAKLDGGAAAVAGDYRYGCVVGFNHLSGGLWGIMRVYPRPSGTTANSPTPIGAVDDPRAGGHPLKLLGS